MKLKKKPRQLGRYGRGWAWVTKKKRKNGRHRIRDIRRAPGGLDLDSMGLI